MKIIPKLAQGGGFAQYMTVYSPSSIGNQQADNRGSRGSGSGSSASSAKSKSSDDDKNSLSQKDFFRMLEGLDGLPNEMQGMIQNLQNMFALESLTGRSAGDLSSLWLQTKMNLEIMKQNSKKFDEAVKTAKTNGALGEFAIAENGNIMVQSPNGLTDISVEEYKANPSFYRPVTNSQLANLRSHDMTLRNNQEIFSTLNNAIGFESFQKLLDTSFKNLGTSQTSLTGEYSYDGQAVRGLEALKALKQDDIMKALGATSGLAGLYKYTSITKSQQDQINALRQYMLAALPKRFKTFAQLKVGKDETTSALYFIDRYISAQATGDSSLSVQYQGGFAKVMGKGSNGSGEGSDGTDDKTPVSSATQWLAGSGMQQDFIINSGTNMAIGVKANTMALTDGSDKPLGINASLAEVSKGSFGKIFDWSNATVGGSLVNTSALQSIIVTDGKVSRIDYPIDSTKEGIVPRIDRAVMKKCEKVQRDLKAKGIDKDDPKSVAAHYDEVKQIYADQGLPCAYLENGYMDTNSWGMFAVMNGIFAESAVSESLDKNLVRPIVDDREWEQAASVLNEVTKTKVNPGRWYNPFNNQEDIYQGTIWVPVLNSFVLAQQGENMKLGQWLGIEPLDRNNQNNQLNPRPNQF